MQVHSREDRLLQHKDLNILHLSNILHNSLLHPGDNILASIHPLSSSIHHKEVNNIPPLKVNFQDNSVDSKTIGGAITTIKLPLKKCR